MLIVFSVLLSLPLLVKECLSEFLVEIVIVGMLERALARSEPMAHLLSNFAVLENSAFLFSEAIIMSANLPPTGLALVSEMARSALYDPGPRGVYIGVILVLGVATAAGFVD